MSSLKETWKLYFKGLSESQIKKKTEIKESFRDIKELLEVIVGMDNNKFVYIPKELIILPGGDWNEISPNSFKKKYNTIDILTLKKGECLKDKMPQQKILEACMNFYSNRNKYFLRRGISWTGITDERKRVILFYDLFLGWKLFSAMKKHYNQIKPRAMDYYKTSSVIKVPSKYNPCIMRDVYLKSLPAKTQWVNLDIISNSPAEPYRSLTNNQVIKEVIFSPEKIAAYLMMVFKKTGFSELEQFLANPFITPTESMVKIINRFDNNVLRWYEKIKNDGTREESCRKLNYAEKTILISRFIPLLGVENSFVQETFFNKNFVQEKFFNKSFIDYVGSYMLPKK